MKICTECKKEKSDKAFIGYRVVCRLCYYYLSKEEKQKHILYSPRLYEVKNKKSDEDAKED